MASPGPSHPRTYGDRAFSALCRLLAHAHRGAGWLLVRAGGLLARGLAPFPWSCRLAAMAAAMAVLAVYLGLFGQDWLIRAAELTAKQVKTLGDQGLLRSFAGLAFVARYVGVLLLVATFAAFVRHRAALHLLRIAGAGFAVVWAYLLVFIVSAPSLLYVADAKVFDKSLRNELWVAGVWLWLPAAFVALVFLLALVLRAVTEFYGASRARAESGARAREPLGDRVVANLKTHGADPRFRTSTYWSSFLHLFVLFLLPVLIRGCGMEKAYGVPKGSGNPVVQMVKIKRIKKKKPRKEKLVLNMDSPIIFYRPEIDESLILKQVEEETRDTYVASSLQTGKLGKGGPGKGGWPHGMENACVRFLRLEYKGGDWDQDMGVGADYNFLIQFQKMTGFKIAETTEHLAIPRLRRFPKHRGPPFVFITGAGNISVSRQEINTLRWYCLEEGGMIFADNGGGTFNSSFRSLMLRCFPELDWVDIANDDILFSQPFIFPGGAPPLWHHSGSRALGLKHNGRWIVFYHQGDLNDAWKTGHSGVSEGHAMQAYRLGVNIVNYAFNQYMAIHYGD